MFFVAIVVVVVYDAVVYDDVDVVLDLKGASSSDSIGRPSPKHKDKGNSTYVAYIAQVGHNFDNGQSIYLLSMYSTACVCYRGS